MEHEGTIRSYYTARVRDDLGAVPALCTEDVVAVNVPIGPIHGKDAVRTFLNKFGAGPRQKRQDGERILVSGDVATVLRQLGLPLDGSRPEARSAAPAS